MKTYCTRPNCSQPINEFSELDDRAELQTSQQKYCNCCGMPQILAGRYIPQQLLGKGGFGAAYLAIDRYSTQLRQCVVKQFQPSASFREKHLKTAEKLFRREAEVLESLGNHHPQIPDLYAFFPLIASEGEEEKQFFYIVQQYIDGETLEQELQRKGRLQEAEIWDLLENLLSILKFVHEHNSIHRDIKPSNIIRDREGKIYLLDFGAVKRVTGASTGNNYSTGIFSMGFAPPEQMHGREIYPSTDLYALAATCMCLLTGQPIQELYDSYNNQWRWDICPEISEKLCQILQKMLLATPKDRFASAEGVLSAFKEEENTEVKAQITESNASEESILKQPANLQSLLSVSQPPQTNPPEKKEEQEVTPVQSSEKDVSPSTEKQVSENAPTEVKTTHQSSVRSDPPLEKTPSKRSNFPLWEILANVGFTGSEGALLLIALTSVFSFPAISVGLWGMTMGGLIYAQWKRWIEKFDLLILGGMTLGLVIFIPPLSNPPALIVVVATVVAGAGAIALVTLLRLILQLMAR
ncbi:protein kinase [Euhalothece natronophila Z-M001]|uniref:non-specific serine/threonine protein kinase n=1 Tax=Euhalothece natronophila Z-M001 TaxID=522448 RepID=A0A5B8NQ53_9CHRO|nr:serine/threonine-protein kinase [Euhalothece natronophila]QDZ41106.1 protein kinase [Euhalothece natronophila Z-M001]